MRIPRLEALRQRRALEKKLRDQATFAKEKAAEIAQHRETVVVSRETYPAAWKFVEDMFPRLAKTIRETTVLANKNTYFCQKVGIPREAGGLFIIKASTIVICHSKHPDDVVIVHEMLHYCSQLMGSRFRNEGLEEDFAYQTSVPYLAQQGYSEDWIAEKYLLAYYSSKEQEAVLDKKKEKNPKLTLSERNRAQERALEKCKTLVRNILRKPQEEDNDEDDDLCRFSFM